MTSPLGVILAGGQSSRMGGGDKCLLTLGDTTLLDHVIGRLKPQVSGVALNANGHASRFAAYGMDMIPDSIDGFAGPLAGVLAGMDWAAAQVAELIVTAAADTPFFPKDLVRKLQGGLTAQAKIAMAATPDPARGVSRHPTFALWPTVLRDDLRQALTDGLRKVIQWTDRHGCAMVAFPVVPYDPFFNVNTPSDMARAQEILAGGAR